MIYVNSQKNELKIMKLGNWRDGGSLIEISRAKQIIKLNFNSSDPVVEKMYRNDFVISLNFSTKSENFPSVNSLSTSNLDELASKFSLNLFEKSSGSRILEEQIIDSQIRFQKFAEYNALDIYFSRTSIQPGFYTLKIDVNSSESFIIEGKKYQFSDSEPIRLNVEKVKREDQQLVAMFQEQGERASDIGQVTSSASQVLFGASVLFSSNSGIVFIKMVQSLKLFNRLRYININFGQILGNFLKLMGNMFQDDKMSFDKNYDIVKS